MGEEHKPCELLEIVSLAWSRLLGGVLRLTETHYGLEREHSGYSAYLVLSQPEFNLWYLIWSLSTAMSDS